MAERPPTSFMTPREVMEYFNITRLTLKRWRENQGLPHVRIGPTLVRYPVDEVLAWAERRIKGETGEEGKEE